MYNDSFVTFLTANREKRFFLYSSPGNAGDTLLQRGLTDLLSRESFNVSGNPDDADIILIHGGSNINDIWRCGITLLQSLLEKYPEKTIVVAPHTYVFHKTNFEKIINGTSGELHLFAREKYSKVVLDSLTFREGVFTYLANDTAFLLKDSDYISGLREGSAEDYILCAMRTDRESAIVPYSLDWTPKNVMQKIIHYMQMFSVKKFVLKRHPELKEGAHILWKDVSYQSYDSFLEDIKRASVIVTDRLHVGILGALLNKKVYLYPTKYDKVRGVYEQSLTEYTNVVLNKL